MACRKMNEYVAYARNTESGCKLSVDEIDTIFLLRTRSLTDSGRKPILQQNYTQVDRDKQG